MTNMTRRHFGLGLGAAAVVAAAVPSAAVANATPTLKTASYALRGLSHCSHVYLTQIASLTAIRSKLPGAEYDDRLRASVDEFRITANTFMFWSCADPDIIARKRRLLDYAGRINSTLIEQGAQPGHFTSDIESWSQAIARDVCRVEAEALKAI